MDITESEIVEALYHIVRACEEQRNPPNPEAMEIDPDNSTNMTSARQNTPSVPSFLRCCVNYRITPPQLRLALREQNSTFFSAPGHALVILRILIEWLQVWLNRDVMLSSENKEQCERPQAKNGNNEVPELQKVRYSSTPVSWSDQTCDVFRLYHLHKCIWTQYLLIWCSIRLRKNCFASLRHHWNRKSSLQREFSRCAEHWMSLPEHIERLCVTRRTRVSVTLKD